MAKPIDIAEEAASAENRHAAVPDDGANWHALDRSGRLRILARDVGGNSALSARSGVALRTLQNYLAGREMPADNLVKLAMGGGVTVEWLATGRGPMRLGEASQPAHSTQAPPASPARDLFGQLDMDRLARAYTAALQALAASGQYKPDARRIMQVTILLYDQISPAEPSK